MLFEVFEAFLQVAPTISCGFSAVGEQLDSEEAFRPGAWEECRMPSIRVGVKVRVRFVRIYQTVTVLESLYISV